MDVVDTADYVVWRKTSGQTTGVFSGADGNGDGTIDQGDYEFWRARFGNTAGSGSSLGTSAAVPEPGTIALAVLGLLLAGGCRKR